MAVGRDLRAMAALQQRLVAAQQSMERDYARLRHVETRYRLLFQVTAEAVLIVDASSHKVVEANPAAAQLLGESVKRLVGRTFLEGLDQATADEVRTLLTRVETTGRAENVRARLTDGQRELLVYAALFRQENASLLAGPAAADRRGLRHRGGRQGQVAAARSGRERRPTASWSPTRMGASSPPTPRFSISPSLPPRSRRVANRWSVGSAGRASTSTC